MKFFNVKTSSSVKTLLQEIGDKYVLETEKVNIIEAVGRVISTNIEIKINVPEFDRSTVDGYAIKSLNSIGASETSPIVLNVIGEVLMGHMFTNEIGENEAVYVPTGGMIPIGADTMCMIEDTEKLDENTVMIYKSLPVGSSVVYKGEDLKMGNIALQKNKQLKTNDIGVLAALGISEVEVYRRPKITIISTGDEIVDITEPLTIGQIRDINRYVLVAMTKELGGEVVNHFIVKDNYELLKDAIINSVKESDITFLSGGSSVGTRDFTYSVIEEIGQVLVHGVAIKPGKPTIIGLADNKMVVGLPGHPMSSIVIFKTFFEPYILRLLKQEVDMSYKKAILDNNVHGAPGKETYQMVELVKESDVCVAKPIYSKSGFISTLSKADGFFVIDREQEGVTKGAIVNVFSLTGKFGGEVL